jgi:hypothetical protein
MATANAWSDTDKDAAVVLTNSDRTARCSTTAGTGVRSTQRQLYATTGKWYAEFVVDNRASSDWTAGMSRAALSSNTGAIVDGAGNIKINNIFQTAIGSLANNDVISIAYDSGGNLFWARKNSGVWNNSGTANPDTGVGGFDTSFLAGSGDVPLSFYGLLANTQCTVRTNTADFTIASRPTTNFKSWMNESLVTMPILVAVKGSLVLAGSTTGLRIVRAATVGSVVLSGKVTGLIATRKNVAVAGSVSLGGQTVALRAVRKLAVTTAGYTLTGVSVNLAPRITLVPPSYTDADDFFVADVEVVIAGAVRPAFFSKRPPLAVVAQV